VDPQDLGVLKEPLTNPAGAEVLLVHLSWAIEVLPEKYAQEGPQGEFQEDSEGAENRHSMAPRETAGAAAAGGAVNPKTGICFDPAFRGTRTEKTVHPSTRSGGTVFFTSSSFFHLSLHPFLKTISKNKPLQMV
jgi:hypothetical protein